MVDRGAPSYATCPTCGDHMLPVLELTPCGHAAAGHVQRLDSPGTVYSWTRTHQADGKGRLIAMADFLDGSLRVTGPVVATGSIAIGDEVRAAIGEQTPIVLIPVGDK